MCQKIRHTGIGNLILLSVLKLTLVFLQVIVPPLNVAWYETCDPSREHVKLSDSI